MVAGTDVFDTGITVPAGRRGPPVYPGDICTKPWLSSVSWVRSALTSEGRGNFRSIDILATTWSPSLLTAVTVPIGTPSSLTGVGANRLSPREKLAWSE